MSVTKIHTIKVEFGDCDPAGIVFFPNFLRWYDAAASHFFQDCGIPDWRDAEKTHGILGIPVVDLQTRFVKPATYGDTVEIHTSVIEWNAKTFVMKHELKRNGELLHEGRIIRVFATRHPDDPSRSKAVPVPEDFREKCS